MNGSNAGAFDKHLKPGRFTSKIKNSVIKNWELYLFCIPGLVLLIIFYYIPMFDGILMSFKDYKPRLGVIGSPWIGLHNYRLFLSSFYFWNYLINTLRTSLYSISVSFPLPIVFAIMVNSLRPKILKRPVQTISYAPNFVSVVVVIGMINLFFSDVGLINNVIRFFGKDTVMFFAKGSNFTHFYAWSGVWQTLGYSSILYLAVLSNVDVQQLEAATIDGATKMQKIIHIEFPTLIPTATIMLIFNIGNIMGPLFEKILLLQNAVNLDYSEVISTYVYKVGIINSKFSFSAAVGMFNSVANFILLTAANLIARKVGETSLW